MRVGVVVVDGMLDLGLVAVLDVLATADRLAPTLDIPAPMFAVTRYGAGRHATTAQGLRTPTTPWREIVVDRPDLLVLPALGLRTADAVVDHVRDHAVLDLVTDAAASGTELAAACSATFFLAEAALLDGRKATTSWWLGPGFRARYPAVRLDDASSLVVDGPLITAGAAFAHIHLALALVARRSPALADLVSRYLVVGERTEQVEVAVPSVLAAGTGVLADFERHARAHLAHPVSIREAAHAIGTSERTLQRVTAATLGLSPLQFVQQLRLEHARHLMRTTERSSEQIAHSVGYRNASTLQSLLARVSPRLSPRTPRRASSRR